MHIDFSSVDIDGGRPQQLTCNCHGHSTTCAADGRCLVSISDEQSIYDTFSYLRSRTANITPPDTIARTAHRASKAMLVPVRLKIVNTSNRLEPDVSTAPSVFPRLMPFSSVRRLRSIGHTHGTRWPMYLQVQRRRRSLRPLQGQSLLFEPHDAERLPPVLLLGCVERLSIIGLATRRSTLLVR